MLRGQDHCSIESNAVAGDPSISGMAGTTGIRALLVTNIYFEKINMKNIQLLMVHLLMLLDSLFLLYFVYYWLLLPFYFNKLLNYQNLVLFEVMLPLNEYISFSEF